MLHSSVANAVKEVTSFTGFRTEREDHGCFKNVAAQWEKQPSSSIGVWYARSRPICFLEVSYSLKADRVTRQYTRRRTPSAQRAAEMHYEEKVVKYGSIAETTIIVASSSI